MAIPHGQLPTVYVPIKEPEFDSFVTTPVLKWFPGHDTQTLLEESIANCHGFGPTEYVPITEPVVVNFVTASPGPTPHKYPFESTADGPVAIA
jgi:hypothetical protein